MPLKQSRSVYYHRITHPNDAEDFHVKLKKVLRLNEAAREHIQKGAELNIQQHIIPASSNGELICGTLRVLRFLAPSIGERGTNLSEPIPLDENQGINEKTHFVFMPQDNVIAIEYNHHGPKIGHLVRMVNELYKKHYDEDAKNNSYTYLSARVANRKLREAAGLRSVTFEYVNLSTTEKESLPYSDAVKDLTSHGDVETVQITLKPLKNSRSMIMRPMETIRQFIPGLENKKFSKLQMDIVDESGLVESIDFMKDQLVRDFNVPVLTDGTKEINSVTLLEFMVADLLNRVEEYREVA